MAISRMLQPRQQYGLGSFVKSAVKGVTGAVKGVAGGVKDFVKSDAGKLALLGGALYLGGGTGGISSLFGKAKSFLGGLPGAEAIGGYLKTKGGRALGIATAGALLGGVGASAEQGDPKAVAATRDVGALRNYLFEGYKNLGYTDDQAQELTEKDTAEYTSGQGGYATGGRVQYGNGSDDKSEMAKRVEELMDDGYTFAEAVKEIMKEGLKNGGRPGFAMGNKAEQNAINAAGIMGLPLNQNPAGVTELDLRETGGFIAPVGVKEKADDIPAMLSNNEFVFTADAVRAAGGGSVNKGAQKMYNLMKSLENKVV